MILDVLIYRATILSSLNMLGNIQYFQSEKKENLQNMNYFVHSQKQLYFYSHADYSVTFTDNYLPALPSITERKGNRFGHAVGSVIDGVTHVTSHVSNSRWMRIEALK